MARTDHIPGGLMLSPPCRVVWCGWESTTTQLARAGWEAVVNDDPGQYHQTVQVIFRHRRAGWSMYGECPWVELMRAMDLRLSFDRAEPVIMIRSCRPDSQVFLVEGIAPAGLKRVDLQPNLVWERKEVKLSAAGVFQPWIEPAQEIIVDPETVSGLLERIKLMQSSELAEIRERNRQREARDSSRRREQVVAQVVTLSA